MVERHTAQESRQGRRGRPVLVVLLVSVGLMIAALAGLMIWQGETAPPDYASQSQAAARTAVTGSGSGAAVRPAVRALTHDDGHRRPRPAFEGSRDVPHDARRRPQDEG